ncbi:retrovirus-related Pol polyprotein from transposon 412 [Trichonephila clavipes]|nr:retrovirus-related Pol polyprotein from transposon 412 [Trichonephila clavipes]
MKTLQKVRERFYWNNSRCDVKKCCRICDPCAARKGPKKRTRGRLQLYNVGAPFERIAFDILGLLPRSSEGNNNILVVMDYFTKWSEAYILFPTKRPQLFQSLAKEARDIDHKCTTITLDDANAVAKHRIMNHTFKKPLVTEFDCRRIITSTIARLRTEHLKGMKIHPDKTRSYVQCKHCPDLQLTPNHILECPTVATKLLKMGMVPLRDSLWELLYSPDAPRIAEAVIKTFDGI